VDYVPFEDKVEVGEWFYTSGDDRIFPRGFAAGVVKAVRPGQPFQEILIEPTGLQHGAEDVLILLQGVHEPLPDTPPGNQPVYIAPPPPAATSGVDSAQPPQGGAGTEADKLRNAYKAVGEAQNHNFGEGPPGSKPPDFTKMGTPAGVRGATGGPGPTGSQVTQAPPRAPSGAAGITGPTGRTGLPGASGRTSATGATGSSGRIAPSAVTGPTGRPGVTGSSGLPAPAVSKQGDAVRRSNQAAGGPGDSPHQ
jgi:rod shape-determining protein MreC